MKLRRLISLVMAVLMIASISTVCITANAAEIETAETGAVLGSYYNVNYLENKAYNGTDLGSTYIFMQKTQYIIKKTKGTDKWQTWKAP